MNRTFFWVLVPPFVLVFAWFLREDLSGWMPAYHSGVRKETLLLVGAVFVALQILFVVLIKRKARRRPENRRPEDREN